jgi:polar amino acid transport system substrate-binding protein
VIPRRAVPLAALTLAAVLAATACASTSRFASERSIEAVEAATTTTVPATGPTTTTTTLPNPCRKEDPYRSFRPSPLPPRGQLPTGTWADDIRSRTYLRVGVDENTRFFSFKDPSTGRITGFEADIAREIARAIFGDVDDIDEKIKFVTVTTSQKFDVVTENKVDLTIDVATIGCGRWGFVDFSTPYYEAFQQLMVRGDSMIKSQSDLAGKRVCVTSPSSSRDFVEQNIRTATIEIGDTRTECLTKLQENEVDAIVLPSSIQAGLSTQDPDMDLLPGALLTSTGELATNTYGIAVNKSNPELTRFVNALLEQWRRDRTLEQLQLDNFPSELLEPTPQARYLD